MHTWEYDDIMMVIYFYTLKYIPGSWEIVKKLLSLFKTVKIYYPVQSMSIKYISTYISFLDLSGLTNVIPVIEYIER